MITIFDKVVKSFLDEALDAQIKYSEEKDTHSSRLFSYLESSRNKELAQVKRNILSVLREAIKRLGNEGDDLSKTKNLLAFLRSSKAKIETATSQRQQSSGTSEILLDQLIEFVKLFHLKSSKCKLTDQPDEDDAFAKFSKTVAFYYARRILDDTKKTLLKSMLENPLLTPIIAFYQRLDYMVNTMYTFACANIEGRNQSDSGHYKKIKNDLGVVCIGYLILQHDALHKEYALSLYGKLLPLYLGEYLDDAKKAINIQEPLTLFTREEADDLSIYDCTDSASNAVLGSASSAGQVDTKLNDETEAERGSDHSQRSSVSA